MADKIRKIKVSSLVIFFDIHVNTLCIMSTDSVDWHVWSSTFYLYIGICDYLWKVLNYIMYIDNI